MRQKLQQIEYSPGSGKKDRVGACSSVQNQDLPTASSHVETLGRRMSSHFVVEPSFPQFLRAEDAAGSSQTLLERSLFTVLPAQTPGPIVEA